MKPKYIKITLRKDKDGVRYFIENDYGKTNDFVHYIDLFDYIKNRLEEGTIVEISPN